jgi:hypothetical protein
MLDKYEQDLDPPTMMEFDLFRRLGNLLDIMDYPENWTQLQIDEELCEVADLLDLAGVKYDRMLLDYYKGHKG